MKCENSPSGYKKAAMKSNFLTTRWRSSVLILLLLPQTVEHLVQSGLASLNIPYFPLVFVISSPSGSVFYLPFGNYLLIYLEHRGEWTLRTLTSLSVNRRPHIPFTAITHDQLPYKLNTLHLHASYWTQFRLLRSWFNVTLNNSNYTEPNNEWQWIMKWWGFGKKKLCLNFRYCPEICLGGLRKRRKTSVSLVGGPAEILTSHTPNTNKSTQLHYSALKHVITFHTIKPKNALMIRLYFFTHILP